MYNEFKDLKDGQLLDDTTKNQQPRPYSNDIAEKLKRLNKACALLWEKSNIQKRDDGSASIVFNNDNDLILNFIIKQTMYELIEVKPLYKEVYDNFDLVSGKSNNTVNCLLFISTVYPGWLVQAIPGEWWVEIPVNILKQMKTLTIDYDLISLLDYTICQKTTLNGYINFI